MAAYGRRLRRLAALLQQYDAQLHRALAALGLAELHQGQAPSEQQQQQQQQQQQEQESRASTDALAALAAGLQQLEQQLATAVQGASEPLSPDALLDLAGGTQLAAAVAAAGPAAILQTLQGEWVVLLSVCLCSGEAGALSTAQPPPSQWPSHPVQ